MITRRLAYFVGLLSSLSTAGSTMTLLALSASLFVEDADGTASSCIQLTMYIGVATVGIFGGVLLQRLSAPSIGFIGPIASAGIVLILACLRHVSIHIVLLAAFLIFVLGGIDHLNSLRFLNRVLEEDEKITFFSRLEAFSCLLTVTTPVIAAWLISHFGSRDLLGSVIIAGDTIVCFCSFLVLFVVILTFHWNRSEVVLLISSCALVNPIVTFNLARMYQNPAIPAERFFRGK